MTRSIGVDAKAFSQSYEHSIESLEQARGVGFGLFRIERGKPSTWFCTERIRAHALEADK